MAAINAADAPDARSANATAASANGGNPAAKPPPAPQPVACSWTTPGGDMRTYTCPIAGTGSERRYTFTGHFDGGHDDTDIAVTAALQGVPLPCDEGSKPRLFGEDGKVNVSCRLALTRPTGASAALTFVLLWSHGQFVEAEIVAD